MLKVVSHDNRGEDDVPFGFIYFNDGRRVTYVCSEVRNGTGGWDSITPAHKRVAQIYLDRLGYPDWKHTAAELDAMHNEALAEDWARRTVAAAGKDWATYMAKFDGTVVER
jgi:hypothetical protein